MLGMFAWCWSGVCDSTGPGLPMKFPKKPDLERPCQGVPNPMLKPHSTQTTSTTENATNVSIMLLIDQRFCITPPYSTARPGTLIKPTSVAAVSCHEVSPEVSQLGASTGNGSPCPGRCGHDLQMRARAAAHACGAPFYAGSVEITRRAFHGRP